MRVIAVLTAMLLLSGCAAIPLSLGVALTTVPGGIGAGVGSVIGEEAAKGALTDIRIHRYCHAKFRTKENRERCFQLAKAYKERGYYTNRGLTGSR